MSGMPATLTDPFLGLASTPYLGAPPC